MRPFSRFSNLRGRFNAALEAFQSFGTLAPVVAKAEAPVTSPRSDEEEKDRYKIEMSEGRMIIVVREAVGEHPDTRETIRRMVIYTADELEEKVQRGIIAGNLDPVLWKAYEEAKVMADKLPSHEKPAFLKPAVH